jgi:hypothetical protein
MIFMYVYVLPAPNDCNTHKKSGKKGKKMHAQIITYQLNDISQAEYLNQMVEPDAPILADVSGLISKVWLADEEKNTFGGFYLWESKEAMEDFMQSDLVAAVVSRPFVKNVSSVDYTVNEAASRVTRGLK